MLDTTLKAQLKTYLERITLPVELVASLDDSAAASQRMASAAASSLVITQGWKLALMLAASPLPVTSPIRAHIT